MAMADEAAVAEPAAESQPAEPSIAQAYEAEHGDPTGSKRKPERAESGRNTTLAQEKETSNAIAETERKAPRRREPTLSEAHDGVTPDAEEPLQGDSLPEALQDFDPDSVSAAMMRLGLEDSDLSDPRWVNALKDILETEAEADPDATEEEEGAESEETEEGEEGAEKEEDKPAEAKPAEVKIPQTVAEFVGSDPEKLKQLNEHVEGIWNRSQATNSPMMGDFFTMGLARALQTPPEAVPMLREAVEILSTAGYSLVESAVPRLLPQLMNEYMAQNFGPILEHFAPGLGDSFREATASNTWDAVRDENDNFADLPDFGTKEFEELRAAVVKSTPWIENWDPGPNLPPLQALKQKATLFARLALGERFDPKRASEQMAAAIETGRKSAVSTNRRVSAGRALKGGRTTGTMGGEKSERESLMDAWQRGTGGGAL